MVSPSKKTTGFDFGWMGEEMRCAEYRYVVENPHAFVQQVVTLVSAGYRFYKLGVISERFDVWEVDRKVIERNGTNLSRTQRHRRRAFGQASVQYLRFGRRYALVATHGEHRFFEKEADIRAFARNAMVIFGYSIAHRNGHASVRMARKDYLTWKAVLVENAVRWPVAQLEAEFQGSSWEPYAPVRSQLHVVFRAVNRRRKEAGLRLLERGCIRTRRMIYRALRSADEVRGERQGEQGSSPQVAASWSDARMWHHADDATVTQARSGGTVGRQSA